MRINYYARLYIKDVVYGANDGIITTFAVVASIEGAKLSSFAILAVGFASLFADGLSMAASDFLANRSEQAAKKVSGAKLETEESPLLGALSTFFAFVTAGATPLLPYIINFPDDKNLFIWSAVAALATMFLVGGFRTKVTRRNFFLAGLEMTLVGGAAACVAFFIGQFAGKYHQ